MDAVNESCKLKVGEWRNFNVPIEFLKRVFEDVFIRSSNFFEAALIDEEVKFFSQRYHNNFLKRLFDALIEHTEKNEKMLKENRKEKIV